jgi:hypothetical protein
VRGRIIGSNPVRGMFAVDIDGAGVTIVELLDSIELELDDAITGTLDEHGSVRLRCERLSESFDAFVQACGVSRQNLRKQLLLG